jgi:hypothetical protein
MNQPVVQPLVLPERWDLVSNMAKTIAQLKADVAAQQKKVAAAQKVAVAAEKKATTATATFLDDTGFQGAATQAKKVDPVAEAKAALDAAAAGGDSQQYQDALSKYRAANTTQVLGPKPPERIGFTIQRVGNEWRYISKSIGGIGGVGGVGGEDDGTGKDGLAAALSAKPTLASDTFKATLALFFGQAEMSKPWVNELYNVTSKYYKTGSTIDESFNLALQDSRNNPALTEFTKRFKGIYALQDKKVAGQAVSVPTIAEYYASEAKMGDILRQAGLGTIATEDYLGGVIGKGLSVTDVGNYISGIYNEIQNLPKDIKDSVMTNYPNMDSVSLAKAILTGDKGFVQLQKELTSQELFGAAKRQGLAYDPILNPGGVTMDRATQYAAEGLDLATGLTKFGQVAAAAPRVNVLSELTANKQLALTQADLESAVIGKNASQIRKMEQLAAEEAARYQASSGTTKVSLKGPSGGF